MNIQITDIDFRGKEELLSASIYVDGQKAAAIVNHDATKFRSFQYQYYGAEGQGLTVMADEFLKSGEPLHMETGTFIARIPNSLSMYVLKALKEHVNRQESGELSKKAMQFERERFMNKGIVFDWEEYNDHFTVVETCDPLDQILADPKRRLSLTQYIRDNVIPYLQPGERILNTNLSKDFLEDLFKGKVNGVDDPAQEKSQEKGSRIDPGDGDNPDHTLSKAKRMG